MIQMSFKIPEMDRIISESQEELLGFMAAMMQTNRGMLFDKSGAYNGHDRWAPLAFRSGQPLKLTGTLSKSMGPMAGDKPIINSGGVVRISGDIVTTGTKLGYAHLMNFGTTLMPGGKMTAKKAQALMIPMPRSQRATQGAKELRRSGSTRKKLAAKIQELEQEGGSKRLIRRYKAQYKKLAYKGKDGERVIFRKSVKIPARRFDIINEKDIQEFQTALVNKIASVLNRQK